MITYSDVKSYNVDLPNTDQIAKSFINTKEIYITQNILTGLT